jgi:putative endonuclease
VSKENINLGRRGEEAAARILKENGYKILKRNYKTRFSEIDIIARDKDTICFIEVKTRFSDRFGAPLESITLLKQKKIFQSALCFLKENNFFDCKARFDVVSITFRDKQAQPELIKNAFQVDSI